MLHEPGAIPKTVSAHVCVDFVNSQFADHTGTGRIYDRLDLPAWQRWFSERCGVGTAGQLQPAMHQRVVMLRRLIRRLLESRRVPSVHERSRLNSILALSLRSLRLTGDETSLSVVTRWHPGGWPAVMAAVIESYVALLLSDELQRVRVCSNPDCSYMFVDDSHSGTRRWCDVTICGNLVKVRRHRATQ